MDLFVASQFRFQNPNWAACTATSARTMLNLVATHGSGGTGFAWTRTNSAAARDSILAWERRHDTLAGGHGSDPNGWRNALNYYGWGAGALVAGSRVYETVAYSSYEGAVKAAVRALIATGKPVGLVGWRGAHAQMITGYYRLVGNPFAQDALGHYSNRFSVGGVYLTDPLRESHAVNKAMSFTALRHTMTYRWRFQRYYETDSRLDDPYTPGHQVPYAAWHGKYVLVTPIR